MSTTSHKTHALKLTFFQYSKLGAKLNGPTPAGRVWRFEVMICYIRSYDGTTCYHCSDPSRPGRGKQDGSAHLPAVSLVFSSVPAVVLISSRHHHILCLSPQTVVSPAITIPRNKKQLRSFPVADERSPYALMIGLLSFSVANGFLRNIEGLTYRGEYALVFSLGSPAGQNHGAPSCTGMRRDAPAFRIKRSYAGKIRSHD